MFDESSLDFIIFCVLGTAFLGWAFGIAGFFRAGMAMRRIDRLEQIERERAKAAIHADRQSTPEAAAPVEPPAIQPEPVPAIPEPAAVLPEPESAPVIETLPAPPEPTTPPTLPPEPAPSPGLDLEAILTMRWGVWLGAAALLFAGVFLIRYAVDRGLIGPAMRCAMAGLLGMALILGGQWAKRRSTGTAGPRDHVPAALAAGGVAVLLTASYGAGPYYGLLPPPIAFLLMGAAGLGGLALSLSEGRLVAVVGLAGAFLTPALVETDHPSLPGLFAYLLVVLGASIAVMRYTAWTWLGWVATAASALWVVVVSDAVSGSTDIWAPAMFVPAAALLNLALLPDAALETRAGRRLAWVPFAMLGVAALVLVDSYNIDVSKLGLLMMLPVAVWTGWRRPALDRLPWLAALLLFALLGIWVLPPVGSTGEAIRTMDRVQAVLPGPFAPADLVPYLETGTLAALFMAGAGLWLERRTPRPTVWAALTAAVPVIVLAIGFARVEAFRADIDWAFAALSLMGALVGTTALAMREGSKPRAGVHAAGAVAALALALAMQLTDQWLSFAIALILPGLALIEEQTGLRALRQVAVAVAGVVLARLLLNWYVLDYAFGDQPVINGLIVAYALPAVFFAVAALRFRRGGNDLAVGLLFAGAAALGTVFVAAEIHHWASHGGVRGPSLLEPGLHATALALLALAVLRADRGLEHAVLRWAWWFQGMGGLIGAMLLIPLADIASREPGGPLLDSALAAYVAPGLLAVLARREPEIKALRPLPTVLSLYALGAGFVWLTVEVNRASRSYATGAARHQAEIWGYSGAWLAYGVILMALGIRTQSKLLRLAALTVVGVTSVKVFLIDIGGIGGLWRVMSFLGLGLVLIGLGAIYRRFVAPAPAPEA